MKARSVMLLEPRAKGQAGVRQAKEKGMVPGVLYGFDGTATSIQVPLAALREALSHGAEHHPFVAQYGGESRLVLVKGVQRDLYTAVPIHVDIMPVSADAVIAVSVPIHFHGEPDLTDRGLQLHVALHAVTLHGKPNDLPELIDLNVAALSAGDTVTVADLHLPPVVSVEAKPTQTVAHVAHSRVHAEPVPDEPRVIIPAAAAAPARPEE